MSGIDSTKEVLIIDSGAGGLTVAREIIQRQLNVSLHYVADKAHFPYGILNDVSLLERQHYIVEKAHQVKKPDVVIIACNTASTLALDSLRDKWDTPFIGVVPAIKPAAKESKTKNIAVLATPATIEREYLSRLIDEHASDTSVVRIGSHELVNIAENYLLEGVINKRELELELEKLQLASSEIDIVVLACTHFPILTKYIDTYLKPLSIRTIDSTAAIVNRLCQLIPEIKNKTEQKQSEKLNLRISTTNEKPVDHYASFVDPEKKLKRTFYKNF